jgi:hypothetical protein
MVFLKVLFLFPSNAGKENAVIAPIGRLVRSFESAESRILNAANDPGIGTCASSAHELAFVMEAVQGYMPLDPVSWCELVLSRITCQ